MIGDTKWEMGEPMDAPFPKDDADFTWHVHDEGLTLWGTSLKCSQCAKPKAEHGGGKRVHFNINRLQKQNEAGVTSRMMRDEIYASAREEGRDITRAR